VHLAAEHGKEEVLEMLVERGAQLDVMTGTGKMPLHLAVQRGYPEVVAAIMGCIQDNCHCVTETMLMAKLKPEAKPNDGPRLLKKVLMLKDSYQRTPVELARAKQQLVGEDVAVGHTHIVKMLLDNGCEDVVLPPLASASKDADGIPPPYVPPVEIFGEEGERKKKTTRLTAKEMEQYNAIYKLVKAGKYLELLNMLDKGAPCEKKDEFGNTALIAAAQNGNRRFIKVLLRYGADFNAQNKMGNTALHYCKEYHFKECYDYLISKGADPELKNQEGVPGREGLSGESAIPSTPADIRRKAAEAAKRTSTANSTIPEGTEEGDG